MKTRTISILLILLSVIFVSCEKYNADETIENKEANSTLVVRTRADASNGSESEAKVSYPVNVYVFSSNSKCVAASTIASEAATLELNLPEGNYDVYAIAGADADNYDLPTKETATKDYVIALKERKTHADLMTAHSTVNLAFGEANTLTLSLSRKVMLLETVTISGVPTAVTAVSVTISPLYGNILLNGSYSDSDGMQTVALEKGADGTTWKNECNAYLLEASGDATIKVSFTTANGTTSYSYSSSDELKANYKININGTYTGGDLKLSGTVTGATWSGTKNINFNFTESGSTKGEGSSESEEDTGGQEVSDSAPAVGSIYNGCYVLKSEEVSGGTNVTLLAPKSKNKLTFTDETDQTSIKAAINEGITELSVDGIEGWRLPTLEELNYLKDKATEINTTVSVGSFNQVVTSENTLSYYFLNDDGDVSLLYWSNGTTGTIKSEKATYLRAFATVTFTAK